MHPASSRSTLLAATVGSAVLTACAGTAEPRTGSLLEERSGPIAVVVPQQSAPAADGSDRSHTPWEVTLAGSGVNNEDFDAGAAQIAGSVGYFVTNEVEVSVRQGVSFFDGGENTSSDFNGSTRVAADLHFPMDDIWPYIGASFGGVYGDSVNETFAAGPEAGVKVFVQDSAFVGLNVEWLFLFDDDESVDAAFDDGQLVYNLGFGLRF